MRLPAPRGLIHLLFWHLPRALGVVAPFAYLALALAYGRVSKSVAVSFHALVAATAVVSYLAYCGLTRRIAFVRSVVGSELAPHLLVATIAAIVAAWAWEPAAMLARLGVSGAPARVDVAEAWLLHALWLFDVIALARSCQAIAGARSVLDEALGVADVPATMSTTGGVLAVLFPWNELVGRGVTRVPDLVYGAADGVDLRCEVYRPAAPRADAPIVLLLHGGGWVLGSLRVYCPLVVARTLASRGCVVVSATYRLAPEHPFPAQLLDAKQAIAWIRGAAYTHGGDPRRLFVAGESAGANVGLLAALTAGVPAYQPADVPDADTSVAGCVDLFGIHSLIDVGPLPAARRAAHWEFCETLFLQRPHDAASLATYEDASPTRWVRRYRSTPRPVPPILTIHGALDETVPVIDAVLFHDELRAMRAEHAGLADLRPLGRDIFVALPSTVHAFCMWPSVRSLAVADTVAAFVEHVAAQERRAIDE